MLLIKYQNVNAVRACEVWAARTTWSGRDPGNQGSRHGSSFRITSDRCVSQNSASPTPMAKIVPGDPCLANGDAPRDMVDTRTHHSHSSRRFLSSEGAFPKDSKPAFESDGGCSLSRRREPEPEQASGET